MSTAVVTRRPVPGGDVPTASHGLQQVYERQRHTRRGCHPAVPLSPWLAARGKYMIDSDTPDEVVIQLYRCLLGSLLEVST